jgi:hypothetical protein
MKSGAYAAEFLLIIWPIVSILDLLTLAPSPLTPADDRYELISERAGKSLVVTSNRAPG